MLYLARDGFVWENTILSRFPQLIAERAAVLHMTEPRYSAQRPTDR